MKKTNLNRNGEWQAVKFYEKDRNLKLGSLKEREREREREKDPLNQVWVES